MTNEMLDATVQKIAAQNPESAKALDGFFKKHLNYEKFEPEYVKIYKKFYSSAELKDLIDFYNTPTGQKSLKVAPRLTMESIELGQKMIKKHGREIESLIKKSKKKE